jgi:hypothetical protein
MARGARSHEAPDRGDEVTKTYHGAELYAEWTKRGGTLDGWKKLVAPSLIASGEGPLYRMSDATKEQLFARVE